MLWDSKKKCYILPNVQPPCGMVCDFCGKEQYAPSQLVTRGPVASSSSLSSPSDEDLSRMKEVESSLVLRHLKTAKKWIQHWCVCQGCWVSHHSFAQPLVVFCKYHVVLSTLLLFKIPVTGTVNHRVLMNAVITLILWNVEAQCTQQKLDCLSVLASKSSVTCQRDFTGVCKVTHAATQSCIS